MMFSIVISVVVHLFIDNECDRCVEYNYTFFFDVFHFHLPMATHKGTVTSAFTFHRQTDSMCCVYLNINIYSSHRSHIQTEQLSVR